MLEKSREIPLSNEKLDTEFKVSRRTVVFVWKEFKVIQEDPRRLRSAGKTTGFKVPLEDPRRFRSAGKTRGILGLPVRPAPF